MRDEEGRHATLPARREALKSWVSWPKCLRRNLLHARKQDYRQEPFIGQAMEMPCMESWEQRNGRRNRIEGI